tara:strand:- start:624 stop:1151 length:528 start_codon:yes stop_codon:yes gene_type:complete
MNLTKDLKKSYMVIGGKEYYELSKFDRGYDGIEYCNLGGGFLKRIKINDAFMNDYESGKIKFTNSLPSHYIYAKITLDDWREEKKYVKGYYNPIIRWNGWINPYFTWDTCKHIEEQSETPFFKFYEHKSKRRKPIRTLEYCNQYDCETPYIIPSQKINGIEVYDCGLGICWELYK